MDFLDNLESAIGQYVLSNYTGTDFKQYAKSKNIKLNVKKNKITSVDTERLLKAARDFSNMLYNAQSSAYDKYLGSETGKRYIPTVRDIQTYDDGDSVRISVRVEYVGSALHRPSWNPESDGIDNILSLLNTGYKVKGRVPYKLEASSRTKSGYKKVFARRQRDPMGFIDAAMDEFKAKYPEYTLTADDSMVGEA